MKITVFTDFPNVFLLVELEINFNFFLMIELPYNTTQHVLVCKLLNS